MNEFPNQAFKKKKKYRAFEKKACFFKLFHDEKLSSIHRLFSWTSAGPSKCLIDKMIGSQVYSFRNE